MLTIWLAVNAGAMSHDPLVVATIALVVATALLVIATAIPAIQRFFENRAAAATSAARVIPSLNLLGSRIQGHVNRVIRVRDPNLDILDHLITDAEVDIHHSGELRDSAYDISLTFANEIYLTHHFLTAAIDDLRLLAREAAKKEGKESIHDLSDHSAPHHTRGDYSVEGRMGKVCAHYQAAALSLAAAEDLIPRRVRTVDGVSFWDRFRATAGRRETEAEKALGELRAAAASRR